MEMRCTMLSLALCALATSTAAAAPGGRHGKTSATATATATADEADEPAPAVRAAKPRQQQPRRHRTGFYFVAGVAHIDSRVDSGGLQLDPTGLASLAAKPGPMQGKVESDPSNIVAGMIGFAPA